MYTSSSRKSVLVNILGGIDLNDPHRLEREVNINVIALYANANSSETTRSFSFAHAPLLPKIYVSHYSSRRWSHISNSYLDKKCREEIVVFHLHNTSLCPNFPYCPVLVFLQKVLPIVRTFNGVLNFFFCFPKGGNKKGCEFDNQSEAPWFF